MSTLPCHVDVLIVGGGPVGGALALNLASTGRSVAVVEARQRPANDARALAVAHASRLALEAVDAWPAAAATPIHTVHVSQQQAFGRVKLSDSDLGLPALGYVLPYAALAEAIHARLSDGAGPHYLNGTTVSRVQSLAGYAVATLERDGGSHMLTAGLVVLAEGGKLLGAAGIAQDEHDYRQLALVAEVRTDQPHQGIAYERFAHDGPIAMLPKGDNYAVVWTRPADDPLDAVHLPDEAFLVQLQARMGDRAGRLLAVSARAAFPLRLKWAAAHQARRIAVVGNAAQTLHPVAGQGFNLGLRDALALARLVRATPAAQLGDAAMLARYASLRKADSLATVGFTDGLIRLFGVDSAPLRQLRAAGLLTLDNCKPLRRGFAQRMVFGTA
ncbi:2-octaprenyl-6-methoxyphenyl hydroxylase [Chitinimonas arctica]|uniref:2-octaprenyl-6-methoxyphenyl hydroxylase n=1 Tax=Chitinimonas arctica TaxID=2594795 RepID=A0A516SGM9_9NEIS|nr:FAD-dependent monooxygenase [Chitinimonas arctica]QDQ27329.1 2-octaprenyl-6-methoxyphenyl hydroxylase [Chitinimonas arctica]